MKILNKLFLTVMILISVKLITPGYSYSQLENQSIQNLNYGKEYFFFDPLIFYPIDADGKGRLDVYIEIPLENLQFKFISSENKYNSNIDYSIKVIDDQNRAVVNEKFNSIISYKKDDKTKNKWNSEYIIKTFTLAPGNYKVEVTLEDKNTSKTLSKSSDIKVLETEPGGINVSDVMLVSNYEDGADGKKSITPLVTKNVGGNKQFYIFYEINNLTGKDENKIFDFKITKIDNEKKNLIASGTFDYLLKPGKNQKIEKFNAEQFLTGDYNLEITDRTSNNVIADKDFMFRWTDMPVTIKDLDEAIQQCIYIADATEFEKLRVAKTRVEKEKEFIAFWKSKDPTPNTAKNEVMIDYYNRIKISNERYSTHFPGWKTDMGMVYILFGDPNNIERSPFGDNTKPYEIWDYYDINRRFIFVDNTGFGDYRLTEPIWDVNRRSY